MRIRTPPAEKAIEGIAFPTTILTLNVAIEAARVGNSGLGFSVVVDEVRRPARQCAEASRDTSELVENTVAITEAEQCAGISQIRKTVASRQENRQRADISEETLSAATVLKRQSELLPEVVSDLA